MEGVGYKIVSKIRLCSPENAKALLPYGKIPYIQMPLAILFTAATGHHEKSLIAQP